MSIDFASQLSSKRSRAERSAKAEVIPVPDPAP